MRFSPLLFCVAILAFCAPGSIVRADDAATLAERINARRELEIAKSELRQYYQVEYPRQRRHLNAAIELTELEIRDYKARLREWGPFSRYVYGDPFMVTIQETQMCLRDAELRLRDLWAERNALIRFHGDEWRALEWKVFDARVRVAQLEANDETAAAPVADRPAI